MAAIIITIGAGSVLMYLIHKHSTKAFYINGILLILFLAYLNSISSSPFSYEILLFLICPMFLMNVIMFVFFQKEQDSNFAGSKYEVQFKTENRNFKINNLRRGVSIIGAAGSGKTESVVYGFLKH